MISLVDEKGAVNIIFLDFRKAFDTVPHKTHSEKMLKCGLDEQTVRWIKNWLNCPAQSSGQWHKV